MHKAGEKPGEQHDARSWTPLVGPRDRNSLSDGEEPRVGVYD